MDAIPAQMSAIFTTLVDDVQEQINELKQSQTSLLKEVDSIKSKQDHFQAAIEALPAWREALDEKINLMQAQYSMDELKSENRQLQGAVDAILEQHNNLSARVQAVSQLQASSVVAGDATEEVAAAVSSTKSTKPLRRPKLVAHPTASRHASADCHDVLHPTANSQTLDFSKRFTPNRDHLSASGSVKPVSHEAATASALRSSFMPPPPPRLEREHSVASSATFCDDQPAQASVVTLRPPPTAARANLAVAPVSRNKRKHVSQAVLAPNAYNDEHRPADGSRKKRHDETSDVQVDSNTQSQSEVLTRANTEAANKAKRTNVIELSSSAKEQESQTRTADNDVVMAGTLPIGREEVDEDNILVIPRKPAATKIEQARDRTLEQRSSVDSVDHATLAQELLDSVEDPHVQQNISAPSPASVAWQQTRSKLVEVLVPPSRITDAADAGKEMMHDFVVDGPPPPPKAPNLVTLTGMHRQFQVRSNGRENVVGDMAEEAQDSIAYGTVRRSGRAPKPKKTDGE